MTNSEDEFVLPYYIFKKRNFKFVDQIGFKSLKPWLHFNYASKFLRKCYSKIKYSKEIKILITGGIKTQHLGWLASTLGRKKNYNDFHPILKSCKIANRKKLLPSEYFLKIEKDPLRENPDEHGIRMILGYDPTNSNIFGMNKLLNIIQNLNTPRQASVVVSNAGF